MSLDEAVITKISLFERCTSNSAFSGLLEIINAAPDGKSKYLSGTELSKLEVGTDSYPEAWKDHLDFIVEWGQLEPDISSVDLRPVVYLARETLPNPGKLELPVNGITRCDKDSRKYSK